MTDGYWTSPDYTGYTDANASIGLLLAEDDALKAYLTGMTVPTRTGFQDVGVWFRFPDGARRQQYPYLTIDFLGISPSFERWTSLYKVDGDEAKFYNDDGTFDKAGLYTPSVSPTTVDITANQGIKAEPYLMYRLLYQVTTHTRSALDDRILTSRFMTDVFPPRPFWLPVDADHTYRRAELVNMTPNDTLETTDSGEKRIFRKAFTVSMDAELLQSQITAIEKARNLYVDVYQSSDPSILNDPNADLDSMVVDLTPQN